MIFCFGTGFCLKRREDGLLAAQEFVKERNAKVAFESNDNDDGFKAAQWATFWLKRARLEKKNQCSDDAHSTAAEYTSMYASETNNYLSNEVNHE